MPRPPAARVHSSLPSYRCSGSARHHVHTAESAMSPTTLTEVYKLFCGPNGKVPIVAAPWFPVPEQMPVNCKTLFARDALSVPSDEEKVQSWLTDRLTKLNDAKHQQQTQTEAIDTHKTVTLRGRRKPDFSGFRKSVPRT